MTATEAVVWSWTSREYRPLNAVDDLDDMKTLVVHLGTRKTATTSLQASLRLNEQRLAEAGVYIPQAGRLDIGNAIVAHHHLAWELQGDRRFNRRLGGWDDLLEELQRQQSDVALLSSETFEIVFGAPQRAEALLRRLESTGYRVVAVLVLRDWLEYINSLYGQLVKMFATTETFERYVDRIVARGDLAIFDRYQPLLERPGIDVKITTYRSLAAGDPLRNLLELVGVTPPDELQAPDRHLNVSLGATGVEITRHLSSYLHGKVPGFKWDTYAARHLHRESAMRLRRRRLNGDQFWGFHPELAERTAQTVRPHLDALASYMWGTTWPEELVTDRPTNVARFDDFNPRLTRAFVAHVNTMMQRYEHLDAASTDTTEAASSDTTDGSADDY